MSTPIAADARVTSSLRNETVNAPSASQEPQSLIAAVRAVHGRIGTRGDEQTLGLQAAIREHVAREKSDGYLIEHVIVRLKRSIDDAGLSADNGPRAAVNSDIITRCIREYYRE